MAVPRNRLSHSRKNKRRAHDHKNPTQFVACKNCKSLTLKHLVCRSCGFYKGRSYKASTEE